MSENGFALWHLRALDWFENPWKHRLFELNKRENSLKNGETVPFWYHLGLSRIILAWQLAPVFPWIKGETGAFFRFSYCSPKSSYTSLIPADTTSISQVIAKNLRTRLTFPLQIRNMWRDNSFHLPIYQEEINMANSVFMKAEEVQELLGVSRSESYRII